MSSPSVPVDPAPKDPYYPNSSSMTPRSAANMPEIRRLYEKRFQSYQLSPGQPEPTNECRLLLALELAKAMLEHYFPPLPTPFVQHHSINLHNGVFQYNSTTPRNFQCMSFHQTLLEVGMLTANMNMPMQLQMEPLSRRHSHTPFSPLL